MLRVSNLSKCFSQNISSKKGFSLIVFASKWRSWIYWSYFFSEERNKFVRVSFDRAILCSTSVLMTVVTWVHLTNHIAPNKRCTVDKDTGNKFLFCSSSIIVLYLKNSQTIERCLSWRHWKNTPKIENMYGSHWNGILGWLMEMDER